MRSLAIIALLFSAQAFACPELTGSYTCTYQDGSSELMTISQSNKDGVTVYVANGSEIPADNQPHALQDDASLRDATFRAWCNGTASLDAQLLGKYYQENAYYGDLTLNTSFSIVGTDLKQVTTGTLVNEGGSYPLNSEMTCKRSL